MRLGSRAGWGAAIPQHTLLWGGCGMGVELGPCGVMELREASHGAGRVGPKPHVATDAAMASSKGFGFSASSCQQALPDLLPGRGEEGYRGGAAPSRKPRLGCSPHSQGRFVGAPA